MNITLKGHRAFVCGASEGIGKATAVALAESGAQVVVCARREAALQELLRELPGEGHHYLVADMDQPTEFIASVERFCQEHGYVDIIVNNAGGPAGGPLMDAQPQDFQRAMNRLLLSGHELMRLMMPGMKERRYGRVINIISTSVRQPIDNLGVSNTVRAATAAWSKTWSKEVGAFGITINNVLPGATLTGRLADIIEKSVQRSGKSRAEVEASMLAEIPAGRFAQPEEVAHAVVFLASEQAAYINGIHLSVDGGRTKSLL